jgi:hypothetical protein
VELIDSLPAEREKPRDLQCLLYAWLIGLWAWKNGLTPQQVFSGNIYTCDWFITQILREMFVV